MVPAAIKLISPGKVLGTLIDVGPDCLMERSCYPSNCRGCWLLGLNRRSRMKSLHGKVLVELNRLFYLMRQHYPGNRRVCLGQDLVQLQGILPAEVGSRLRMRLRRTAHQTADVPEPVIDAFMLIDGIQYFR